MHNYWLALSMIEGLGPIRISKLLKYFGDPVSIWKAPKKELMRVDGIGKMAENIVEQRKKININQILKTLSANNINFIILEDEKYPQILKEIYDPPPVLFYKGNLEFEKPGIAIVGSRKSTKYGRKTAQKLGYELAQRGISVISGMARGIDTYSHQGALKANGNTVAVLGSGLDYIYPPENNKLFHDIIQTGVIISEFPPGVKPLARNFPRRNRIISGLSLGTIVVEASTRSGSLITANQALEQGREVFAVPGNIYRPQSKGTNKLIKNGAKIVRNVDDILEELFVNPDQPAPNKIRHKMTYPELSRKEEKVIKILQTEGNLHINEIINMTNFRASLVNTLLLKLELKGLVAREPGKKYSFKGLQNLLKPI